MKLLFNFDKNLVEIEKIALKLCENEFKKIEKIVEFNQIKVLKAFIETNVSEAHFTATTGYGYNDYGRETLDRLFSKIFRAEDSLVRHNFVSGTHAISTALFGILRPNDTIISLTGKPYESLHNIIDCPQNSVGSLKDFGINFEYVDFKNVDRIDFSEICNIFEKKRKNLIKSVYIQRSRGYSFRNSLTIDKIKKLVDFVKKIDKNIIIIVDNCYGEFVQTSEPLEIGADLIIGSLIKNPGGGIAQSGGYIAGKKDLVKLCANRLTTVGAGKNIGATFGFNRELFLGIFNAPHAVGEALKTAIFAAVFFEKLGYEIFPKFNETHTDIVQTVILGSEKKLKAFCKGIQNASPIDSFAVPEPWDIPNYNEKIIMAAGTFTSGASLEFTADAPLREPYAVWLQGGINFHSAKFGILNAANEISKN